MILSKATFYGFLSISIISVSLTATADDLVISYPPNAALAPPPMVMPVPPRPSTPPAIAVPRPTVPAQVSRAQFTTSLSNREPTNNVNQVNAGQTVYYFTELVGLQGHTITHKWQRNGAFQLGLQFPVGAERWRVHSSKTIAPTLTGTWTVTVQNDDGQILRQDTLQVNPAVTPALPATAPLTTNTSNPTNTIQHNPTPTTTSSNTLTPVIPAPNQPLTSIPPAIQKAAEEKKLVNKTNSTNSTTTNTTSNSNVSKSDTAKTSTNIDTNAKEHASWDKPAADSSAKPVWETLNR